MKRFKSTKFKKLLAFCTIAIVLISTMCIGASAEDEVNVNHYYTPLGNNLTNFDAFADGALTHMYADYYLDVVYYIDDVQYHYTTTPDFGVNIVYDEGYVNFGDTDTDIVQFWGDHWRIRYSGGTVVTDIEYTDVFIKVIPVDNADISLLESWFEENFTVYVVNLDNKGLLRSFVDLLVGGISGIASGIGTGVNGFVEDLFLNVENGSVNGLSTFGGVIAIFGGVALAIGITKLIFEWIKSIGN